MTEKTTLKKDAEPKRGLTKLAAAGVTLTEKVLKAMVPGEELADPEHPGLRVRCVAGKPKPRRIFTYRYRNPAGALRQVEVGVLGSEFTLADIRTRWQALQRRVRNGEDPREMEKAETAKKIAAHKAVVQERKVEELTVERVVERYLVEKVEVTRKTKGAQETRRMLTQLINFATWTKGQEVKAASGRRRAQLPKDVKDVAKMPAALFTREMAHDLLLAYGQTARRAGGMARQELRGAWRYAIGAGFLAGPSPFEKVPGAKDDALGGGALVSHSSRDRYLSKAEAGALLRWMAEPNTYSRTVRDALELVLRTGLRSGEVCGIHSSELVRRDGVLWLDIPAERMKGKAGKQKPHSVPLVGTAEKLVLAHMPQTPGFLFPSRDPSKPIAQKVLGVDVYACSGRSRASAYKHRKVCPVTNWAPHDLRRTARTLLAELGCPYEVAEAILAHTLPGVAGVYNRAQYDAAKIQWLTALGEHLDQLVTAKASLTVAVAA